MTAAPIAFQSSQGQYSFEGVTELVNCYAEQRGNDSKAPLSVVPVDGIVQLTDTSRGPCRGMIYLEDLDKLYHFHGFGAYRTTYDGTTATTTLIGTVPGTDAVQLSRNQNVSPETVVQGTTGVQILASDSLFYSADGDFPTSVVTANYVGGYSVYGKENRVFFISGINDSASVAALDFSTFQQKAGKLVRVIEHDGELIGFCSTWIEFWRDTGAAAFPFQPIGFRTRGLKAANAVVSCDNTLMFPGDDSIIYRLNNYEPGRISNHTVERLIRDDTAPQNMVGFSWSADGHAFANFTGTSWSRCYDAATGTWHTRKSYGYNTWRAQYSVPAWGKVLVGDTLTGKIGYLSRHTYTEFGDPIVWQVTSPPLHVFPNGAIIDAFHMDVATGYGLLSGQGSNPLIMLEISKDGGNQFQQYRELSLGIQGKYATRVTARRLGKFGPKGIVFRLTISDPVARALVATDVELRPLKNPGYGL